MASLSLLLTTVSTPKRPFSAMECQQMEVHVDDSSGGAQTLSLEEWLPLELVFMVWDLLPVVERPKLRLLNRQWHMWWLERRAAQRQANLRVLQLCGRRHQGQVT